jgi:thioredoxin-related protein
MVCLRRGWPLLLFALLASPPPCVAGEIEWHKDLDPAWKQAREEKRPLLVFITTSNCRYCTLMQSVSFAHPKVVELLEDGFVPAAVDAKDVAWLVRDQKVSTFPTTLIIAPSSEIVDRIKGYLKPEELRSRLQKTVATARTASKEPAEKK